MTLQQLLEIIFCFKLATLFDRMCFLSAVLHTPRCELFEAEIWDDDVGKVGRMLFALHTCMIPCLDGTF